MKDQPNPNARTPLTGRNCTTCGYTAKLRLQATDIAPTLVCAEGPPQLVLAGGNMIVMQPPVNETMSCFRHATREEIAAKKAAEIPGEKGPDAKSN